MELLDAHGEAMNSCDKVMHQVGPQHWRRPTPCADWSVRDLVNHLVYEQLWAPHLLAGATLDEVGDRFDGDVLGDDPIDAWERSAADARAAWTAPGALTHTVHVSSGLADATERHGVFMDVLGLGVLITGESGVGKSELGLELISRGHGLVADDVVEISRIAANTLEGRCPPMLKDFLEVRGLGLLNIRTIFGETAVRPRKLLKLMVHLEDHSNEQFSELDRLQVSATYQEILAVPIRKVTIPVAAGRNLAVLVEAAVRNFVLNQRGIDSTKEFIERQQKLMEEGG